METKQSAEDTDTATSNATGKLDRSELWSQLQNAISSRSSIDQVYWSSYNMFWATNAVLLVALFSTGKFPDKPWIPIIISVAGLIQFFTWKTIQNRVHGHLGRVEALILRIEEDIGLGERHALSLRLSEADYQKFIAKSRGSSRFAVKVSIFFIGMFWVFLLIYSAYLAFIS